MPEVYKLSTVSKMTGFSPSVLRAWERRYGLLRPGRGPGGQRLYTEEDLRILLAVRQLLAQGRSIGEAAALGRRELARLGRRAGEPEPVAPAVAELERFRQAIVEAALAVDAERLRRLLDELFARLSVQRAVLDVLAPVAWRIGELWAQGRCSVAAEHLVTEMFSLRLRALAEAAQPTGPPALAACFPEERHQLGLLVVAWWAARRGRRVVNLGPALPFEDLEKACAAVRPDVVLLSVTMPELYRNHRAGFAELVRRRREVRHWIVGGQAVPEQDQELSPAGVILWPAGRPLEAALEYVL
ncbi:MAG: MerR family transcriptional regulator [Bryobacterales bacterium]|nr:MerR family transcriptional regulator [Bryobacterales bacterium]